MTWVTKDVAAAPASWAPAGRAPAAANARDTTVSAGNP